MRKLLCVILCLVLCFSLYAQPVTAIAVIDDLAAAAIAVLAACGLSFVFSGLSASGALDKVSGLLSDYAQSIGETVPAWLAAYEMTMFGGKLRLAAGLANKIYGFAGWVQSTYNVQDDTSVDIESNPGGQGLYLADGTLIPITTIQYSSGRIQDLPYGFFSRNSSYNFLFPSGIRISASYDSVRVYQSNGTVSHTVNYADYTNNSVGFSINYNSQGQYFTLYRFLYDVNAYVYSNATSAIFNLGNLNSLESTSIGVDAGVISIPQNPAVDDVLVDVGTIPVGTTVSGVTDIIIDNALAGTLDASIEETADLPPVVPPEAVEDYTIDLTSFFPFCIPFDVYDAITLFSAEPVAPNMPLYMTWRGTQYGFDIDLSSFDSLAAILRRMEIILFIVGLAAVTRRYIKW